MPKISKLLSPRSRAIRRADAARDRRDPATAAQLYNSIIERWGASFGILVQLGNALKDSAAYGDAEKAYRSALELRPLDADCHLQLGHLMKLSAQPGKAKAYYVEANRLDPTLPGAIEELSTIKRREELATPSERTEVLATDEKPALKLPKGDAGIRRSDTRSSVIRERIRNNLNWRRA